MDLAPSSAVSSTWHTWHTMGSKAFLFRIPVQKKSLEQRNLSNESFKKALGRISRKDILKESLEIISPNNLSRKNLLSLERNSPKNLLKETISKESLEIIS